MAMKKFKALALAALMVCSLALMCACTETPAGTTTNNNPTTTTPNATTANYQVSIIGADGKPATSGIIVKFMQGSEEIAMQAVNASGVAAKELDKGDYTVELMFTDTQTAYYYDNTDLTLSATKTELTIDLAYALSGEPELLYPSGDEVNAYQVRAGRTQVTLAAGKRTYFLFTPTEAGQYKLYTTDEAFATGYHGGPHFVQSGNVAEIIEGNTCTVTVSPGQIGTNGTGTTIMVISVENNTDADVETMLYVDRIADYVSTEIPSVIYQTTAALTPWTLADHPNAVVTKFDLTAAETYNLVKDEATGFYHLGSVDGPLVVVCLGSNSSKYLSYAAPYDTILQNTGVNKYFQDENGQYIKKEDYGACLEDYLGELDAVTSTRSGGCVDSDSGLYPLTDDLMYIIQNNGDFKNWWDASSDEYLFRDMDGNKDMSINPENAWLFMCCYLA